MKRLWIALSVLVMVWGFSGVSLWQYKDTKFYPNFAR